MIKKELEKLGWEPRFTYLKNIVFNEDNLSQKGSKFQIVKFFPGTKIPPHYHEKVCEIFYVLSGKGKFIFNGIESQAKKDDIFLCEPSDIHEIINDGTEELVILIFKTNENEQDIIWI